MSIQINQNNQALAKDEDSNKQGVFVSSQIISKERFNKEGELTGGITLAKSLPFPISVD